MSDDHTPSLNPGFLAEAFERTTKLGSEGGHGSRLPRSFVTFLMDHTACMPDVFHEDFELTLSSISSKQEMDAARMAKGDNIAMAYLWARAGLYAINGVELNRARGQDEWLWERLGTKGRQIVVAQFTELTAPGDDVQKKALQTLRIH